MRSESLIPTSCEREIESKSETTVSRRYFTCPVRQNGRAVRTSAVVAVKSAARADADSTIATPNRAMSRTARRSPDPSMRKIGVRAHEWAPAVNKVAAR